MMLTREEVSDPTLDYDHDLFVMEPDPILVAGRNRRHRVLPATVFREIIPARFS
jgi:hypothetical protein